MSANDRFLELVEENDRPAIRKAVAAGEDVNATDRDGRTALMYAILAEDADVETIGLLIELGADVNAHDRGQEWTPLHFAARDHITAVVLALLASGARVDAVDVFGNTPLWRCVMSYQGKPAVVKILLENGADPAKKNHHGVSPSDMIVDMGNEELRALLQAQKSGSIRWE